MTGSAWHITELPDSASVADFRLSSLVPDGNGGLWALGTSTSPGITQRIWHLTNGAWQSPLQPRFGGSTGSLLQLAAVPGTASVWGAGVRLSGKTHDGLIAVEGPMPR